MSLESNREWKSEQATAKAAKDAENEPINKAALVEMRKKYSEENLRYGSKSRK